MPSRPPRDNDSVIRAIRAANVVGFLLAALVLFVLAVTPETSDAGLVFLSWLLVFGAATIVAEHHVLEAARNVLPGVSVSDLVSPLGRRAVRLDPDAYFAPEDYAVYRRRSRLLLATAVIGVVALVGVSALTLVGDFRAALSSHPTAEAR